MKSTPAFALEAAYAVVTAARAQARANGLAGITVVVLDIDGAVRMAVREDPQGGFGIDFACAKARTALGFLRSSLAIASVFKDPAIVTGLSAAVAGGILPLGGGVVVNDAQGRRIGAAAVAGGLPDMDHAIVCAAVQEAGLQVQD